MPIKQNIHLNFSPFGMQMQERSSPDRDYRFGFNGQEKEDEIYGEGNAYDFGARIYDGRLGKFLSLDSYSAKFVSESNYIYAGNNPVIYIDINGDFRFPSATSYPYLAEYLNNNLQYILDDDLIMASLKVYSSKFLDKEQVKRDLVYGSGPRIVENGTLRSDNLPADGYYSSYSQYINISAALLQEANDFLKKNNYDKEKTNEYMTYFVSTVLHEYVHYGDDMSGGDWLFQRWELDDIGGMSQGIYDEEGYWFEVAVWGKDLRNMAESQMASVGMFKLQPLQKSGVKNVETSTLQQNISTQAKPTNYEFKKKKIWQKE